MVHLGYRDKRETVERMVMMDYLGDLVVKEILDQVVWMVQGVWMGRLVYLVVVRVAHLVLQVLPGQEDFQVQWVNQEQMDLMDFPDHKVQLDQKEVLEFRGYRALKDCLEKRVKRGKLDWQDFQAPLVCVVTEEVLDHQAQ